MSIVIYLDAVKGEDGATKSLIPVLKVYQRGLLMWFDRHNSYYDEYLYGPGQWYEFSPSQVDELLKDCQDAIKGVGWFFENPIDTYAYGDYPMETEDYQHIADTLEDFKNKQGKDWEKLWFLYNAS